jgi:hypothetical protein
MKTIGFMFSFLPNSEQQCNLVKLGMSCDSGVGPRRVLNFMSDLLKQEVDFSFRMAILGLKWSWLGALNLAVQERDGIDRVGGLAIGRDSGQGGDTFKLLKMGY